MGNPKNLFAAPLDFLEHLLNAFPVSASKCESPGRRDLTQEKVAPAEGDERVIYGISDTLIPCKPQLYYFLTELFALVVPLWPHLKQNESLQHEPTSTPERLAGSIRQLLFLFGSLQGGLQVAAVHMN